MLLWPILRGPRELPPLSRRAYAPAPPAGARNAEIQGVGRQAIQPGRTEQQAQFDASITQLS